MGGGEEEEAKFCSEMERGVSEQVQLVIILWNANGKDWKAIGVWPSVVAEESLRLSNQQSGERESGDKKKANIQARGRRRNCAHSIRNFFIGDAVLRRNWEEEGVGKFCNLRNS